MAWRVGGGRWTIAAVVALSFSLIATSCSLFGDDDPDARPDPRPGGTAPNSADDWFAPPLPGSNATIASLCDRGVCSHDVVLPGLHLIDSVTDVEMPETLGALSLERIWTGEREGIFGRGWESPWDLRVTDGQLVGPVPSEPTVPPEAGERLTLADGTELEFDDDGLVVEICVPQAVCTTAIRSRGHLVLSGPGDRSIDITITDGRATRALADDGRTVDYEYVDGLLAAAQDENDIGWSYRYNDEGRLTLLDGPDSRRTVEYDDEQVATVTDPDGVTWTYTTTDTNVQVSSAAIGSRRTYRFDGELLVEAADAELGPILTRTVVDARVTSETRPKDELTVSYLDDGLVRAEQRRPDEPPQTVDYRYDALGRIVRVEGPDGETALAYDGAARNPTTSSLNGAVTRYEYDSRGLLVSTIDADGYRIDIGRDETGAITQIADGLTSTNLVYDSTGRLIEQAAAGRTASATYDPIGRVASTTDAAATETKYAYDDAGRVAAFGPDESSSNIGYDDAGRLTDESIDSLGLDPLAGQRITNEPVSSPTVTPASDGTATYDYGDGRTVTFDERGLPTEVTVLGRRTTRSYDASGRLTALELPDGRSYQLAYTAAGRIKSIDTGDLQLDATWHGDKLLSLATSDGGLYEYEWGGAGELVSAAAGPTAWRYEYDEAGRLALVDSPVGRTSYTWGASGEPITSTDPSGINRSFTWEDGQLTTIRSGEESISLTWSGDRLVALDNGDDELAIEYGVSGRVAAYDDGDDRTVIGYGPDGVDTVERGDDIERWEYTDGEVSTVRAGDGGDEVYQFEWIAPGLARTITHDDETLMSVEADEAGHVTAISDSDGDVVASFTHDRGRVASATVGDDRIELERDPELRLTRAEGDDADVEVTHEDGAVASVRVGEDEMSFDYADGRLSSSTYTRDDDTAAIDWDDLGRATTFESSEGSGSFEYDGDRVSQINYDEERRVVEYDDEQAASADGTGGEFLDDLFTDDGRFIGATGPLAVAPTSPLLDQLPADLGFELPTVTTADDIAIEALDSAVPALPAALTDDEDEMIARAVGVVLSNGAEESMPLGPAQATDVQFGADELDLDDLIATSPTTRTSSSILDRLGGDRCLLCRASDVVVNSLDAVGSVFGRALNYFRDNPVSRSVVVATFLLASLTGSLICGASVVCVGFILGTSQVAGAVLEGETTPLGIIYRASIGPLADLAGTVSSGDPNDLLRSASIIAGLVLLKRAGTWTAIRSATRSASCSVKRVVCVSLARWGGAAEHIQEGQAQGYGRLLRLNRSGSVGRRTDALRGVARAVGLDRDEYPPAFARADGVMPSIRYIDPALNRGLGASLSLQTRVLPDRARFYIRVVP